MKPGRPKVTVLVSDEERLILRKALASSHSRERDKARVVLKASEGSNSIIQLSELTGRASMTIQRWLAKWRRGGIDALMEIGRGPGKKPRVPQHVQEELKDKLHSGIMTIKEVQDWFAAKGIQLTYAGTYYWVEKLRRIVKFPKPVRVIKKAMPTARRKFNRPQTLFRARNLE